MFLLNVQVICTLLCVIISTVFCAEPYINITRTDPAFRKNRVIHAIQGQDVTLTCYAENVDPNLSKVIWIRYYHDTDTSTQLQEIASNTDLPDNTKFSIDKPTTYSWRLRVKNVQVKDTGEYVCFVRTTSINKKESSMKIFVNVKPLLDPTMTSTSMLRTVGDTVQLGCAGTGLPIPNIKWTRLGGAPLPDPINREVYTEPRMTLTNIQAADRGTYRCRLINSVGEARRDIKLDIRFAPMVRVPHPVVRQATGYLIELQCLVEANPFPGDNDVAWIIGTRTITEPTKDFNIKNLQGAFNRLTYELIIYKVQDSDYGSYRCRITNSMGVTYGAVELKKSDTPMESYKLGRVVKGRASSITSTSVSLVVMLVIATVLLI